MNEKNLIPMNERTASEQREIAHKGGVKSGESRRTRKYLRDIMSTLLTVPIDGNKEYAGDDINSLSDAVDVEYYEFSAPDFSVKTFYDRNTSAIVEGLAHLALRVATQAKPEDIKLALQIAGIWNEIIKPDDTPD